MSEMRPDSVYECIENYDGSTKKGETIYIQKGKQYLKTSANGLVFLNEADNPAVQLSWLDETEFENIVGQCLQKVG